jgi:phosphate transport system substrate-binding protein
MSTSAWSSILIVGAICCGPIGCSGNPNDVTVQGSGATFPAPLYKRWFLEYYHKHPEVRVNYTPIGSGAGIRQFSNERGLVIFGASDAGMSKKEIEALPPEFKGARLLPLTAGSIVLAYNVPGIKGPLKLSRKAYMGIFLREITNWNDEEIARHNPDVKLPDQAITVVVRADSSGTTDVFTHHLEAVGKDERVGLKWEKSFVGKSIEWPKNEAIKAQGNDGVAALIQLTPGAIGYLEFGYAELARLPMAVLENYYGKFMKADQETELEALKGAKIPPDLQIKVPDPAGPDAYPIVTYTWVLCRGFYAKKDAKAAHALKKVIEYCVTEGQDISHELGYIPLPDEVRKLVLAELDKIIIED